MPSLRPKGYLVNTVLITLPLLGSMVHAAPAVFALLHAGG